VLINGFRSSVTGTERIERTTWSSVINLWFAWGIEPISRVEDCKLQRGECQRQVQLLAIGLLLLSVLLCRTRNTSPRGPPS
jgi:hypothetical protein